MYFRIAQIIRGWYWRRAGSQTPALPNLSWIMIFKAEDSRNQ